MDQQNSAKKKSLDVALSQIEKQFGKGSIMKLGEKTKEKMYRQFVKDNLSDYYLNLSEKRLAELYYLSKNEISTYIEVSSSRYQTTLGTLLEGDISKIKDRGKYVKSLENQIGVLKFLLNRETYNSSEWLLVKQSLETAESALLVFKS